MPNTALTLDVGRQTILSAVIPLTFANVIDTAVAVKAVKLPYGAIVVGGFLNVSTAFDTATSATLAIGDPVSGTRYGAAVNLKAAAVTALTLTGYVSDGSAILVTPTLVGANATVGAATLIVNYIITNRAVETQTGS